MDDANPAETLQLPTPNRTGSFPLTVVGGRNLSGRWHLLVMAPQSQSPNLKASAASAATLAFRPAEDGPGKVCLDALPGFLGDIAEVAGYEAARLIAQARGGSRVYFPALSGLHDDNWLVMTVGRERAELICQELIAVGSVIEIPLGCFGSAALRRELVRDLTRQGMSTSAIALKLKITERGVTRIRSRLRAAGELP